MMKVMTLDEVLRFEAECLSQGASFVSLVAETPLRHNKTNRETGEPFPWSNPRKVWWGVFSIGGEYENRVVNRIARERGVSVNEARSSFSSEKPSGKHRVVNPYLGRESKLVLESDREPGKYYFRVYTTDNPNHVTESHVYDSNNTELKRDEIAGWMPPSRTASAKQTEAGVGREVMIRDITLTSIRNMRAGENEFVGLPGR